MADVQSLVEQLKQAGITPQVVVQVPMASADTAAIQALQAALAGSGAALTVQVVVTAAPGGEALPGGGTAPGGETPAVPKEAGMPVRVIANKLNCLEFDKRDQAGKPIMEIREPRIQLFQGMVFNVSTTHKAGDKDKGDGTVVGTGGVKYYFVVDCPPNPQAEGLYVKQADVSKV